MTDFHEKAQPSILAALLITSFLLSCSYFSNTSRDRLIFFASSILKKTGDPIMALTKAGMISMVSEVAGIDKKKANESVEKILEIIKSTLESGEDVLVSGFGKFSVNEKNGRRGRNPATGESLMLSPRRIVTFRYSGKLKDRMNKKK